MYAIARWLVEPEYARDLAFFTQRKAPPGKVMMPKLLRRYFQSEHSVLYPCLIEVLCTEVPYRTHVHFVRHSVGVHFYVTTTRPDLTGKQQSLDDTVDFVMVANPVSLVNIARKRLCGKAAKPTQELMKLIKKAVAEMPQGAPLADLMVETCKYRHGCPEFKTCGRWK